MSSVSLNLDNEVLARDYDRISAERQFKNGQILVSALGIVAGERVLDVGCGTGLLAEYVANLVGEAGGVLGIDPLPLRIEIAQRRVRLNLSFRVGDANNLSAIPAESFDVIYLNAVLHWLPEKLEPLRQMFRILRVGGRLGISTGSKNGPNRLQEIKARVLAREPYSRYPEGMQGRAYWISPDDLRALLVASGFTIRMIEERTNVQEFQSPEAIIRFSEASSFGNFLGHLPAELRDRARGEIASELAVLMPAGLQRRRERIVAIAEKPRIR